jgi:hypothetical protein
MPRKTLTLRTDLALREGDKDAIEAIQTEILEALEMSESRDGRPGNLRGAAALLDVHWKTLNSVIEKLGLTDTIREQFPGKGKPRPITIDDVSHTASEWSRISGVGRALIVFRLARKWNERDAVWIKPGER